jgi:hypothetical protein
MNDVAAHMRLLAEDMVAHAAKRGLTLDYGEASLVTLDQIVVSMRQPGKQTAAHEQEAWLLATGFGAYLGEVVIRTLGGTWGGRKRDDGRFEASVQWEGIEAFPLTKVYKRLTGSEHDNTAGYLRALRAIRAQRA